MRISSDDSFTRFDAPPAKGIRSADRGSCDPDYELLNLSFGSRVSAFTADTIRRDVVRRRRSWFAFPSRRLHDRLACQERTSHSSGHEGSSRHISISKTSINRYKTLDVEGV